MKPLAAAGVDDDEDVGGARPQKVADGAQLVSIGRHGGTADDLTDIALGDAKMQLDEVTIELLGDRDGGGVVDQLLCDMLEHVAHAPVALRAPDRLGHRAARGTSASGRPLRTRSERAVAVGRAPFLIQWRARSASTTRSAGSVRGL